jgi:hypothetical protein
MGMNQVSIEYSQDFIGKHSEHSVSLSIVAMVNSKYSASVVNNVVVVDEREFTEHVQDTGFYLYCGDCGIEQEVNMSDCDYD